MPSKPKTCHTCDADVGRRSDFYCDYHAGYHAGRTSLEMREKRKSSPKYRERERAGVKKRMLKLRAARAKRGLTVDGRPMKYPKIVEGLKKRWARTSPKARKRFMEKITQARLAKNAAICEATK